MARNRHYLRTVGVLVLLLNAFGCGGAGTPPANSPPSQATDTSPSQAGEAKVDETPREPATVEQAIKVLDLRTVAAPEGVKVLQKTLGHLSYESKEPTKKAFDFANKQLTERGWKQLPDARVEDAYCQASYTRDGFFATVSASPTGDGETMVSMHNYGNVPASQAPAPPDLTSEYSFPHTAGYVTKTAKIPETAEAIRKLLVAKGWQAYGGHSYDQKFSAGESMEFKRNAILLHVSVTTHENRPGETMVQYSMQQLASDLPPPANFNPKSFHYSDREQMLTFDTTDKADAVGAYYREALGKQGWKPTTDPKGMTDMLLVFRNPANDMIMLDVKGRKSPTRVTLRYYSAAQTAEFDKRMKDGAKKDKAKDGAEKDKAKEEEK